MKNKDLIVAKLTELFKENPYGISKDQIIKKLGHDNEKYINNLLDDIKYEWIRGRNNFFEKEKGIWVLRESPFIGTRLRDRKIQEWSGWGHLKIDIHFNNETQKYNDILYGKIFNKTPFFPIDFIVKYLGFNYPIPVWRDFKKTYIGQKSKHLFFHLFLKGKNQKPYRFDCCSYEDILDLLNNFIKFLTSYDSENNLYKEEIKDKIYFLYVSIISANFIENFISFSKEHEGNLDIQISKPFKTFSDFHLLKLEKDYLNLFPGIGYSNDNSTVACRLDIKTKTLTMIFNVLNNYQTNTTNGLMTKKIQNAVLSSEELEIKILQFNKKQKEIENKQKNLEKDKELIRKTLEVQSEKEKNELKKINKTKEEKEQKIKEIENKMEMFK